MIFLKVAVSVVEIGIISYSNDCNPGYHLTPSNMSGTYDDYKYSPPMSSSLRAGTTVVRFITRVNNR
jgi:hypothetical protein